MGYVLKAVLSSAQHPEYGQITVPFPIPDEKYDRMIELLEPLEIGDALRQDCRVDELDSFYTGGRKLAECILKYRRKIYDQPIQLEETDYWYELRAPAAVSFYEEHVFHDNAADAQWFHSHMGAIAEATCRGLCEYFGIEYRAPGTKPAPAPTPTTKEETINMELRMLRRGMEGNDVRAAMLLMKDKGYYPDTIWEGDKLFGPKMEAGLRKMQADHNLGVDGILGAASWGYLLGR